MSIVVIKVGVPLGECLGRFYPPLSSSQTRVSSPCTVIGVMSSNAKKGFGRPPLASNVSRYQTNGESSCLLGVHTLSRPSASPGSEATLQGSTRK